METINQVAMNDEYERLWSQARRLTGIGVRRQALEILQSARQNALERDYDADTDALDVFRASARTLIDCRSGEHLATESRWKRLSRWFERRGI